MPEPDGQLLELLRAVNPVPVGDLEDHAGSPSARALFERIVADETTAWGPSPRRTRRLAARPLEPRRRPRTGRLAIGASVVILSVGVAGFALIGRHPQDPVACFATADVGADAAVIGIDSGGAVATCSDLWAEGAFGPGPIPLLGACVLKSGVVGVFPETPDRDVCVELGLASLETPDVSRPGPGTVGPDASPGDIDPAEEADRFVAFRDTVLARFLGQGCVGSEPATAIVREELERAGLASWVVTTATGEGATGFSPERPCASLAFFPDQRTVTLVPFPPTG